MSHRSRSRTAESTDGKKPRRLTEKIAIMKKREHEQLEAFEHAMQSIHEMQRARIHSGGGSMPSLQAIDSTPPGPSIDMQMVFQDYNEVTQAGGSKSFSNSKDRPHSGGPSGRRGTILKTSSMDTDPYPTSSLNHSDHYCYSSHSGGEWTEGDLSRHKSDSDLQQSLLMQQGSPQHTPLSHGSSQQQPRNHKLNTPGDLALWRRTNSASTAHALLSPDQYVGSQELPVPSPLGVSGAGGSLPDLTNIEFSSGLEIPLEKDEPPPIPQPFHQQQQALLQQQQQQSLRGRSFFSPPSGSGPGPSNLLYTSLPANSMTSCPLPPLNLMHSLPLGYPSTAGFQFPLIANQGLREIRPMNPPMAAFPGGHPQAGRITKSPTMPDFRTLHSIPHHPNSLISNDQPFTRLKPILPTSLQGANIPSYGSSHLGFIPHIVDPRGPGNPTAGILPPMTIVIQPPNALQAGTTTKGALDKQPQREEVQQAHLQQQHRQQQIQTNHATEPPPLSLITSEPTVIQSSHAASYLDSPLSEVPHKPALPSSFQVVNSLPNTPTITISPGLPMLPSYIEAKQQQALQQKFASINVGKNEALIRSHSEENLQKMQKEKSELIQQNPFMGTLTNANSVPCVYVEAQSMDQQLDGLDGPDSPTNLDSPSTSASYASSPPSVRPFWLDHPSLNEFVFHEWPMESGGTSLSGGGYRPGSPPHHHRSLTDLIQNPIPELHELDRSSKVLAHQLSLPSVAMTDLTMEEHRQHPESPSEFLIQPSTDFDMEDSVMELINSEVSDLHSFDMAHMLHGGSAGLISHSDALLSSSPDSFLGKH